MKAERWQHIEELYHAALELQPESRDGFLNQACAGDEELRRDVATLVACDGKAASFIEKPALEIAAKALADGSQIAVAASSPAIPPVPRQIGPYRLLALLGSGGMGIVYRARDERLGRDVALKILPDVFAKDPERLARFEREAKAVAALSHPNILGIYEFGNSEGVAFAAMELLEGETLRARLDAGALPARKAMDCATQVAQALAAAHERGIIHRDLKPQNVFVTTEGRIKILDFGLAKLRHAAGSAEETGAELTDAGVVMGTVSYMSPEQVRGQDVDARSDIFAFGAILYEVLSGRRAFGGDSVADTINVILNEDPPEFARVGTTVSPAIERVVQRCLEKRPSERFQSARDLGFALEAIGTDSETPELADKLSAVDGDLQIGRWLVQQRLNTIGAGRKTTRIEPNAMEVLLCMARHAGKVVSREALLHEVWGDTLVTDSVLTRCIAELRKVFDDDGKEPGVIETIANQGYRLVASVRPAAEVTATVLRRPGWWAIAAVATLGVMAAFGMWLWTSRSPSNAAVTRLTVNLGNETLATDLPGHPRVLAISPDGSTLAYIARDAEMRRLYLRPMSSFAARAVPGTEGASAPFFSPDGAWVGFGAKGKLYKLPVAGGPPLEVCVATILGGSWGADGKIVFADGVGLHRVSAAGGAPELVARPEGYDSFSWPEILPDGAHALVTVNDVVSTQQIDLVKLSDGSLRKVLSERGLPRYVATGHIAFTHQGQVMIVPFDPARLTVTGTPLPVLAGVGDFAISRSGTLCYATDVNQRSLAWLDRRGLVTALPVPPQRYHQPVLAPDGRRIAVTLDDDIWIYSLDGEVLTPLTFDHDGFWPIWTPDGRQVIYTSRHGRGMSLVRKNVDGTGEAEQLVSGEYVYSPMSCSPDGRLLVFDRLSIKSGLDDVWVLPLVGERRAEPLIATANSERNGLFSPDGRWIAYVSDESGRNEVYVCRFPRSSGKWQVSTEGAREPLWSRDGRELFYRTLEGNLKVVAVTLDPAFSAGKARLVYSGPFRMGGRTNFDITPKGDRFLIVIDPEAAPIKQLQVVLNWLTEIKAHVRAKN